MSRIDAQSKTGDSQPVTTVAMALPADPSRADPKVRIHHHGSEARTVIIAAPTLRTSCFMVPPKRAWLVHASFGPSSVLIANTFLHQDGFHAVNFIRANLFAESRVRKESFFADSKVAANTVDGLVLTAHAILGEDSMTLGETQV